ncbi:MAG: hypothetical protein ACI8PZ_000506 [Myxococcota bacterium]
MVGAYWSGPGSPMNDLTNTQGRVSVLSLDELRPGSTIGDAYTTVQGVVEGECGAQVGNMGDVDGEMAISCSHDEELKGSVHVLRDVPAGVYDLEEVSSWSFVGESGWNAGTALGGINAPHGEGERAFLFGSNWTSVPSGTGVGAVYIIPPPFPDHAPIEAHASLIVRGEGSGDILGSTALGQDVSADGLADLLIGAEWAPAFEDQPGTVYLYRGPLPMGEIEAESTADVALRGDHLARTGYALDASHDLDGDGRNDVFVGGPRVTWADPDNDVGRAWLVTDLPDSGEHDLLDVAHSVYWGNRADDGVGTDVDLADLDQDGQVDVLVTAVWGFGSRGEVFVFYSPEPGHYVVEDDHDAVFEATDPSRSTRSSSETSTATTPPICSSARATTASVA